MYLVPVAGPIDEPFDLRVKPGGLGRHDDCELLRPADADRVSRFHARFEPRDAQWTIVDLASRWGTSVNGVRLAPGVAVPLAEGDLVRVRPFTFVFSAAAAPRGRLAMRDDGDSDGDAGRSIVRTLAGPIGTRPAGEGLLQLVLACAEQLQTATDEQALAERLMDAALRGSGLTNAAFLRAVDPHGRYEVVAARFGASTPAADGEVRFSQSLIRAAAGGQAAELSSSSSGGDGAVGGQSIVRMQIASALCVPLLIGQGDVDGDGIPDATIAAYLYLDARGTLAPKLRPHAREFCVALGRIASLSLANIKRIEIERRSAKMDADLRAAADVQAWMLPRRHTRVGLLACIGESRAGQMLGGDFFDLIDLGDDRVAVTIGDVSGKGIIASVLMTATHGHLHAALKTLRDPALAVAATHRFIEARRPSGKFVTAWVGVIDVKRRTLRVRRRRPRLRDPAQPRRLVRRPGGRRRPDAQRRRDAAVDQELRPAGYRDRRRSNAARNVGTFRLMSS